MAKYDKDFVDISSSADVKKAYGNQYQDKPIPDEIRKQLKELTDQCNKEGELHIQIIYDEPDCFNSRMAHYGRFENCRNYIAMIGRKSQGLEERCGYYGEKIVLKAQELGLNTCWVALTHGKSKAVIAPDEKEVIIIALGYGKTQGVARKSKDASAVSNAAPDSPEWNALLAASTRIGPGGAGVSTFMSPLEKACGNAIAKAGGKWIVLSPEGFSTRWHPPREKERFCAQGRMLFLSLYEASTRKPTRKMLYERCHEMIDLVMATLS